MIRTFAIMILFLIPALIIAQGTGSTSKKAQKRFDEAVVFYRNGDVTSSEQALLKAIQADDRFIDAYHLLSQICYDSKRLNEAIKYYSRPLAIDPDGNPEGYRLLAGMVIQTGDYHRCLKLVEKFLSYPAGRVKNRSRGELLKEKCLFALEAMEHPVPFVPKNLGDSINSGYSEYWPSLSVDEKTLMFTVMLPVVLEGDPDFVHEDLFISRQKNNRWSGRKNVGPPLNTHDNEGAQTMTADGKTLYFTACNRRDGQGQCDIYRSDLIDGKWGRPRNLSVPVNSRYSEKHPTISADGRVLMFASNRPGGKDSYDIWVSVLSDGAWGQPQNLGDSVNTPGLELSPFLHPDQQSLYFSSTGWPGMGQGDLFLSRKDGDMGWSGPVNLGYPINTHNDEIGLTINSMGTTAYFASDRKEGKDLDLYTFELPERVRPVLVSYLAGRVYDARTMRGVVSAIQLIDLETEEVVMETASVKGEGDYLVPLPTDRDYALNVTAEGYLFYSDHFPFTGTHSRTEPFQKDIPMDRIVVGSSVVLNNIFFETDSHALLPASVAELNRIARFLINNSHLSVEIGGHTDNTGGADYNQALSEMRASSVVEYLAEKGIPVSRMKPVGYGLRKPVADNSTEEGRALNRRTELTITEIE